jgi:hypothetical protein
VIWEVADLSNSISLLTLGKDCPCIATAYGPSCAPLPSLTERLLCACTTSAAFASKLGVCIQELDCPACAYALSSGITLVSCPASSTASFTPSAITSTSLPKSAQSSGPTVLSHGEIAGIAVGSACFVFAALGGFLIWKHFHVAKVRPPESG